MTSMTYFHRPDCTGRLPVQHAHMLVPWPLFDGWDEAFPALVGPPHLTIEAVVLKNLLGAVANMRERGKWETMSGMWCKIVAEITRRRNTRAVGATGAH